MSWVPVGAATLFGLLIAGMAGTNLIALGIIVPLVIAIAWSQPKTLLLFLVVWTATLGLTRRILTSGSASGFAGDPLLIVGPMILLCLLLVMSSKQDSFKGRSTVASVVLGLNVLAILEVVNPGQGSIMVGIAGLLFMLFPVCAFWVGRSLVDEHLMRQIVWTVAILGLIVAIYGLYQTFSGFPSWDASWLKTKSYSALTVQGQAERAFGLMSSSQDYAAFLSIGLMAWVGVSFDRIRKPPRLLSIAAGGTVATALLYSSVRTAAALTIIALSVVVCAIRRLSLVTAVFVAPILVVASFFGIQQLAGDGTNAHGTAEKSSSSVLFTHQLNGLTDPTGQNSTLNGHLSATLNGMGDGISRPLGLGTGSVTIAVGRYNNGRNLNNNTEYDPGNMGVAFGILGLFGYFFILVLGLSHTYRAAMRRHDSSGIFALGVLMVMLFEWFNGDLYASSWLMWLCLGFIDGYEGRLLNQEEELAQLAAPTPRIRRRWSETT